MVNPGICAPPEEIFWRQVMTEPNSGCWLWIGSLNHKGYGLIQFGPRSNRCIMSVHRFAYEHWRGPIADGLELDHICRVRCCANPLHLEQVSHRENILRGQAPSAQNARRTHCKHGHALTPQNIYEPSPSSPNARICRICTKRRNDLRRDQRLRGRDRDASQAS